MKSILLSLLLMGFISCGEGTNNHEHDDDGGRIEVGAPVGEGSSRLAQTIVDIELCAVKPQPMGNDWYREHVEFKSNGTFKRFFMSVYYGSSRDIVRGYWGADEFMVAASSGKTKKLFNIKISGNTVTSTEMQTTTQTANGSVTVEVDSDGLEYKPCDGGSLNTVN